MMAAIIIPIGLRGDTLQKKGYAISPRWFAR
jgi:hypothetical protein